MWQKKLVNGECNKTIINKIKIKKSGEPMQLTDTDLLSLFSYFGEYLCELQN